MISQNARGSRVARSLLVGTVMPLTRDVLTEIQPFRRGIVDDRGREHEWMDLADENVETGIGQGDAPAVRPEGGWLIERHLVGAGRVDQA